MKTRTIIAASLLGVASVAGGIAANASIDTGAERRAAAEAKDAARALAKRKAERAITNAEQAVALSPRNAAYRTLLGKAYLLGGRFTSAAGALSDALSLDPADGAAALHLALAQIALGEWGAARETLTTHEKAIPTTDRGLALALAGDPSTAVEVLSAATRDGAADAKTRQNLALALGLAGRWAEAKTIAAFDVGPAEIDARIRQWMVFAQPKTAADQVASLLGVVPVEDGGQPERLALNTTAPTALAVAQPVDPVDAFMPGASADATPTPTLEPVAAQTAEVAFTAEVPAKSATAVAFAERREVVQTVATPPSTPVSLAKPVRKPAVVRTAVPARVQSGNFYVQLGAFQNVGVAKDAWGRLSRRYTALSSYTPYGARYSANGANFYRLAVGGFSRGDADRLCRQVRANRGVCFVRAGAGDQVAAWSRKGVQLAAR
ncbi:Tetratricopeptide repeat-containing protein [Sphingomonas guangdongensis]|uniref:Tetratricopeptide repeat-containing protein n=1 Tax=Sphingomonas guangdongensis TaxID=1141890 RepID=A0A285QZ72_9SPHN|nr:SPOR domain-containing protein [Sphingomonas guangdongensis]SOB87203.1 Tetratricopeptide repeat-containing protein [Sphingomonas guangdongensis]